MCLIEPNAEKSYRTLDRARAVMCKRILEFSNERSFVRAVDDEKRQPGSEIYIDTLQPWLLFVSAPSLHLWRPEFDPIGSKKKNSALASQL